MSVTGRTSVIPYGVWISAAGRSRCRSRNSGSATGAPAESTSRIRASGTRWLAVSWLAVATTLRSAAGEAKTRVPPTAAAASASAIAVRVPGRVTSIRGTAAPMPSAGPYSANGANAATSRSSRVMPQRARTSSS
jgi:hypothetical protein